jgi:hypothetical protein
VAAPPHKEHDNVSQKSNDEEPSIPLSTETMQNSETETMQNSETENMQNSETENMQNSETENMQDAETETVDSEANDPNASLITRNEEEPDWLRTAELSMVIDDPRTEFVTDSGEVVVSVSGVLPPPLLLAMARRRIEIPTINKGQQILYMHGNLLRFGVFVVRMDSYKEFKYSVKQPPNFLNVPHTVNTGRTAFLHRSRREAREKR